MKKIFVCLCAVAALAACQKNQIISSAGGPAIGFENASVDKATKSVDPSTTTETINEFAVWGYMDSRDGVVFENEPVSKNGSEWTYTNTQYWMAGHTYYFAAVSPVADENVTVKPATTGENYVLEQSNSLMQTAQQTLFMLLPRLKLQQVPISRQCLR